MKPNHVASLIFMVPGVIILTILCKGNFWLGMGWGVTIACLSASCLLWSFSQMYKNMQEDRDEWPS